MSIEKELRVAREKLASSSSTAQKAAVSESVRTLIQSGDAGRTVAAGEVAPDFELLDEKGGTVRLRALLARGPVVLVFFRGAWCSFCKIDLAALERSGEAIRARGATMVAISPQSVAENASLRRDLGLSFPLLSDLESKAATTYRVRWNVPDEVARAQKPQADEAAAAVLPIPSRFVVNTSGAVVYADVDPDYTRRPAPDELLPVLDFLQSRRA